MRHKRAHGERVGTVPLGYQVAADGRQLEADALEQGLYCCLTEAPGPPSRVPGSWTRTPVPVAVGFLRLEAAR